MRYELIGNRSKISRKSA